MKTTTMNRREIVKLLAALGVAAPVCAAPAQAAQSPPRLAVGDKTPAGGAVIFSANGVTVSEHASRTRLGACGAGWHSHPPHLTVCLTDVKAKVSLPGKESFFAENKAGDLFWDPGGSHAVENVGSRDTRVYLIELWS